MWAEYGDLSRFASGDAAVAYAGLENVVYQSGAKRYDGGMSKAGPKLIRTTLYTSLLLPRKHVPGLTEHMQKLMRKGKHRRVAIHSASKKLVRRLWGLESSKTYFQAR